MQPGKIEQVTDEDLKEIAEVLNNQVKNSKCLRHQIKPSVRRCALCEAKEAAPDSFEYARLIYIHYGSY